MRRDSPLKTYTPETQLKLFRNRGFTANSKKYTYTISEEEAGAVGPGTYTDYTPVVATLTIDGKEVCKYQEIREHGSGFKLTVNGAPQVLEQMKKEGQACLKKDINDIGYYGDDWRQYCRCRVKGNTFEYFIDQIGD